MAPAAHCGCRCAIQPRDADHAFCSPRHATQPCVPASMQIRPTCTAVEHPERTPNPEQVATFFFYMVYTSWWHPGLGKQSNTFESSFKKKDKSKHPEASPRARCADAGSQSDTAGPPRSGGGCGGVTAHPRPGRTAPGVRRLLPCLGSACGRTQLCDQFLPAAHQPAGNLASPGEAVQQAASFLGLMLLYSGSCCVAAAHAVCREATVQCSAFFLFWKFI